MDIARMPADPNQGGQGEQLRQLLRWLVAVCVIGGLVGLTLVTTFRSPAILVIASSPLLMLVIAGLAFLLVRRGKVQAAAMLIAATLLVVVLGLTALLPTTMPAGVLIPLMAVILLLPYMPPHTLRALFGISLVATIGVYLLGIFMPPLIRDLPPGVPILITGVILFNVTCITLLLLWQFSSRLLTTLQSAQIANAALKEAQATLEQQVQTRTAELRTALAEVEARSAQQAALLTENSQQRELIREMSVPVLPVAATTLVMPLIGALDSARLQDAQEQALGSVQRRGARRLILDITGVPVVDTQVAKGLIQLVQSVRLLGADAVLVGIRPEVAQTIVGLGLTLETIQTAADVQSALQTIPSSAPRR